jgi:pimeloyl-ACP methyl ester carboxylesterase
MGRLVFVAPPDDLHYFIEFFEQLLELSPRVARGFERRLERLLRAPWDEARYCTLAAAADVPVLVVADEGDLETPIAGAERLAAAWPRAELLRTEGLGHRRILRDPEVISRVVGFLSAGG